MKTGYVYDPVYLKHDTGQHVENAGRLTAILSMLEESGFKDHLQLVKPRPATVKEIAMVHDREYIASIEQTSASGGGWLDPDTVVSRGSYEAAIYAAGGSLTAVDSVMDGQLDSVFALVRPPGHHAVHNQAMGFCLFNNIAIATKYALARFGIDRAAIIDFDVHHGNGSQEAFYNDKRVLYISTHQSPLYPGTGRVDETGVINIPLPPGCGDLQYAQVFQEIIEPAVCRFRPELILVSAGYDGHWADRIALMQVSVAGFGQMMQTVKSLADELCRGRIVLTLEGGYHLQALASSVKATFDVLQGNPVIDKMGPPPPRFEVPWIGSVIESIKRAHSLV